jgi:hypothetical protein
MEADDKAVWEQIREFGRPDRETSKLAVTRNTVSDSAFTCYAAENSAKSARRMLEWLSRERMSCVSSSPLSLSISLSLSRLVSR